MINPPLSLSTLDSLSVFVLTDLNPRSSREHGYPPRMRSISPSWGVHGKAPSCPDSPPPPGNEREAVGPSPLGWLLIYKFSARSSFNTAQPRSL
ncbi:hypothetical protein BaRGS_00023777 [Batillaria attramentaria]|uniref:Uncharacterized protein n=1 Tax=Batillaria attramentaria TaxID=370345 RepID=A0ABD0KCW0_9CAEN